MTRYKKRLTITIVAVLIFIALALGSVAYFGTLLGEESSPDKKYTLRYYSSINPFKIYWSMPGDQACRPRWVRLYTQSGVKLNEKYTTSCELEMAAVWIKSEVILPDGETIWTLPAYNTR